MGKNSSIDKIYNNYVRQFRKKNYSKKKLPGNLRSQGDRFAELFKVVNPKINVHDSVHQFLVIQWFEEHRDFRYQGYLKEYYAPLNIIPMNNIAFIDLLTFVSPQNLTTAQKT